MEHKRIFVDNSTNIGHSLPLHCHHVIEKFLAVPEFHDSSRGLPFQTLLTGKSTGTPDNWWLKHGFPVDFPSNQRSDAKLKTQNEGPKNYDKEMVPWNCLSKLITPDPSLLCSGSFLQMLHSSPNGKILHPLERVNSHLK